MSLIVNVRGTSGSGKSTTAKQILERYDYEPLFEPGFGRKRRSPIAYQVEGGLFILGRYVNGATIGCDGLHVEVVHEMIQHWAPQGHVFCEGLSLSTSGLGRWTTLNEWLVERGHSMTIGFLDTTAEQCIANIYERRKIRGGPGGQDDKPLKTEAIHEHWGGVRRQRERCLEAGLNVEDLHFGSQSETVQGWFRDAGWSPKAAAGGN